MSVKTVAAISQILVGPRTRKQPMKNNSHMTAPK